jgi:CsbD-like.
MDPNIDDLKGRAKEVVGDLTDNDDLKREGKADRAGGKAKEVVDNLGEKAKDLVDDIKDKVHHSGKN